MKSSHLRFKQLIIVVVVLVVIGLVIGLAVGLSNKSSFISVDTNDERNFINIGTITGDINNKKIKCNTIKSDKRVSGKGLILNSDYSKKTNYAPLITLKVLANGQVMPVNFKIIGVYLDKRNNIKKFVDTRKYTPIVIILQALQDVSNVNIKSGSSIMASYYATTKKTETITYTSTPAQAFSIVSQTPIDNTSANICNLGYGNAIDIAGDKELKLNKLILDAI